MEEKIKSYGKLTKKKRTYASGFLNYDLIQISNKHKNQKHTIKSHIGELKNQTFMRSIASLIYFLITKQHIQMYISSMAMLADVEIIFVFGHY